jgi:hypothetical protein
MAYQVIPGRVSLDIGRTTGSAAIREASEATPLVDRTTLLDDDDDGHEEEMQRGAVANTILDRATATVPSELTNEKLPRPWFCALTPKH